MQVYLPQKMQSAPPLIFGDLKIFIFFFLKLMLLLRELVFVSHP